MSDDQTVTVLERPVPPWVAEGILEQGFYHVGGMVARSVDVAGAANPADRVSLWRLDYPGSPFERDPDSIDVLRFPQHPLMLLRRPPSDPEPRPWPTYANGLIAGVVVAPVWQLERTRVPPGAELLRVERSGEERVLAQFQGPTLGWRGSRGYYPPVHFVGTRAKWQDLDVPAEIFDAEVELAVVGNSAPEGFEEVRPDVWRRMVSRRDVSDLFELVLSCRYRDVPCRILQQTSSQSRLLLLADDPTAVEQLGAEEADIGTFELTASNDDLVELGGTMRSLASTT